MSSSSKIRSLFLRHIQLISLTISFYYHWSGLDGHDPHILVPELAIIVVPSIHTTRAGAQWQSIAPCSIALLILLPALQSDCPTSIHLARAIASGAGQGRPIPLPPTAATRAWPKSHFFILCKPTTMLLSTFSTPSSSSTASAPSPSSTSRQPCLAESSMSDWIWDGDSSQTRKSA